jgi:hypothetical protein
MGQSAILGVVVDMPLDVQRAIVRLATWFREDGKATTRTFKVAGCVVRLAKEEKR